MQQRMPGPRTRWKPKYLALQHAHRLDAWYFGGAFVLGALLGVAITMLGGW